MKIPITSPHNVEKAKEILKAVEKGIENDEMFVVEAEELRDVLIAYLDEPATDEEIAEWDSN